MKTKKEFYVSPTIEVVEINGSHTLLTGSEDKQLQNFRSGGKIDEWSNDDEE